MDARHWETEVSVCWLDFVFDRCAVDERERSGIPNLTQQQQRRRTTIHGVTNIKQPWNPLMYYSKQDETLKQGKK